MKRIERSARALYEWEISTKGLIGSPWDRAADEIRNLARHRARIVLEADGTGK